jgi:heptosyltransferase II
MNDFGKILVIRTDRMGDVILTTPAMKAIRVNFPTARVAVLLRPATADLVRGNPFVDDVLLDDINGRHHGVGGFLRLVREIRRHRFDVVFIFHTKRRTNLLSACAGIPVRIGYRDHHWGGLLTHPLLDDRAQGNRHEALYCMDVVTSLGLEAVALRPFVPLDQQENEWAQRFFMEHGMSDSLKKIIAIHLGSSDPEKCWSLERYAETVKALEASAPNQFAFILVGDADVSSKASGLQAMVDTPLIDVTGKTTVARLGGVLSACDGLISNDSGPVHLADALGIAVISIFTRNQPGINPERWRPLGERSRTLAPDVDRGSNEGSSSREEAGVEVRQVVDAVDALFKV